MSEGRPSRNAIKQMHDIYCCHCKLIIHLLAAPKETCKTCQLFKHQVCGRNPEVVCRTKLKKSEINMEESERKRAEVEEEKERDREEEKRRKERKRKRLKKMRN